MGTIGIQKVPLTNTQSSDRLEEPEPRSLRRSLRLKSIAEQRIGLHRQNHNPPPRQASPPQNIPGRGREINTDAGNSFKLYRDTFSIPAPWYPSGYHAGGNPWYSFSPRHPPGGYHTAGDQSSRIVANSPGDPCPTTQREYLVSPPFPRSRRTWWQRM